MKGRRGWIVAAAALGVVAVAAVTASSAVAVPRSLPTDQGGAAVATATAVRLSQAHYPNVGGCRVFPAANAWNTDISRAPLRANSAQIIASIQAHGGTRLHPDFGSDPSYGIPYVVVPSTQAKVPIVYDAYGGESDRGPFPIPLNAPVEGGSDRHVLVAQQGTCGLFELFDARRSGAGWVAGSGAKWNLSTGALRPVGWTSADAAGLPILPGLVRYDEVAAGKVLHAIRVTFARTRHGFVLPATHLASDVTDVNAPPMGLRLRLKASYSLTGLHGASLVIATALQRFGLIVADNGSNWFFQGSTDRRWNDTDLDQLKGIPGSAFEVVDTGPVRTS